MSKFALRMFVLVIAVASLQLTIVPMLRQPEIAGDMLDRLERHADVIHFCDSTNQWTDPADRDGRSICQMAQEEIPDLKLTALDHPGFQPEVYETIVDLLAQRDALPDMIVVPINLRTFSLAWDRRPQYDFAEVRQAIEFADQQWWLGAMAARNLFSPVQTGLTEDQF